MFFANGLMPFTPLFLVEIKHATPLILGIMGTVSTLTALVFTVPFGRLADKYGRKKIIYVTRPLSYASTLATILAPSPEYLVVSSFLGAFAMIGMLMEITMEHELVPAEQRGRWGGFLFFLMGVTSIPGPLLLGFLWQIINPAYLLLLPIFADLPFLVVLPTIRDTLHLDYNNMKTPSRTETGTATAEMDPSPR
jgi:MFS family permease